MIRSRALFHDFLRSGNRSAHLVRHLESVDSGGFHALFAAVAIGDSLGRAGAFPVGDAVHMDERKAGSFMKNRGFMHVIALVVEQGGWKQDARSKWQFSRLS